MEMTQRRRIGLPLTVLIVGLLLVLLGAALTLLDGELTRRTQLDAAGLQATLDGVKAAYMEAGAKLAEGRGEGAAQSDVAAYAQSLYDEQLTALVAQVAPEQQALVRLVIKVLPYVPYRFPLLAAGGVLALMGAVWLAVRSRVARSAKPAQTTPASVSGERGPRAQATSTRDAYPDGRVSQTSRPPVNAPERPAYCSGCGTRLRPSARFCGRCGRPVQ